jgi:hypothetical protein
MGSDGRVPNFFSDVKRPEFKPVIPRYGDSRNPASEEQKIAFLKWSLLTGFPPGVFLVFSELETAGTMNPLAHAGENGPDGNLKKSGSNAAGLFQFIPSSWDKELNRSGQEFLDKVGYKPGQPLIGNNLFQDKTYSDAQFLKILEAHINRPVGPDNLPIKRGSDESLALRANLNLITFMKAKHSEANLVLIQEAGIKPEKQMSALYEGHVFGDIRIHRAHQQGLKVTAASLYPPAFVKANEHLFKTGTGTGKDRTVSEAVAYVETIITNRAAELEKQAYGRSFVETAEDRAAQGKRAIYTPTTYIAPNGQSVTLVPGLVRARINLAEFVDNVVATETEVAQGTRNTPTALRACPQLSQMTVAAR